MSDTELLEKIQEAIDFGLQAGSKLGVIECEGFGLYNRSFNFAIEKDKPKHNLGINHGVAFRVFHNNAIGFAFTSSLNKEDIEQTVKLAFQTAKAQKADPDLQGFAGKAEPNGSLPLDKQLFAMDPDYAASNFEQLLNYDLPKDVYFLQAGGMYTATELFLKNSNGLDIHERDAAYGVFIAFLSTHGFPTFDFHFKGARQWGKLDPSAVAQKAIEKTLASSAPKTLNVASELPVIFTPDATYGIMGGLFYVLTTLLRGDKASRGETPYSDKIGEEIAAEGFTLIDDPLHPNLFFSATFDGEGTPTQRTALIDKGILQTYYLDRYYAKKLNMESNGKAVRGGGMFGGNPVQSPPSIGSFNTVIEPGDASVEEMIAETREGFMIKSVMGVHMSDFSSGRFAVTGSGWYIKNGEKKFAVQDITLASTIPELLLNIDMISKEREHGINSLVPYLRVSKVKVTSKKLDLTVRLGYKLLKLLMKLKIIKNPFI